MYYEHTNDQMNFATSATERMRIDSTGRVGIGSTSPGYGLDILCSNTMAVSRGLNINNQYHLFLQQEVWIYKKRINYWNASTKILASKSI